MPGNELMALLGLAAGLNRGRQKRKMADLEARDEAEKATIKARGQEAEDRKKESEADISARRNRMEAIAAAMKKAQGLFGSAAGAVPLTGAVPTPGIPPVSTMAELGTRDPNLLTRTAFPGESAPQAEVREPKTPYEVMEERVKAEELKTRAMKTKAEQAKIQREQKESGTLTLEEAEKTSGQLANLRERGYSAPGGVETPAPLEKPAAVKPVKPVLRFFRVYRPEDNNYWEEAYQYELDPTGKVTGVTKAHEINLGPTPAADGRPVYRRVEHPDGSATLEEQQPGMTLEPPKPPAVKKDIPPLILDQLMGIDYLFTDGSNEKEAMSRVLDPAKPITDYDLDLILSAAGKTVNAVDDKGNVLWTQQQFNNLAAAIRMLKDSRPRSTVPQGTVIDQDPLGILGE